MEVLVIDGQGGRIGQQLIRCIRERFPETAVIAVGTNSMATAAMLKGGAQQAATGENAVAVAWPPGRCDTGPAWDRSGRCAAGGDLPGYGGGRGSGPGQKDPHSPQPLRFHRSGGGGALGERPAAERPGGLEKALDGRD